MMSGCALVLALLGCGPTGGPDAGTSGGTDAGGSTQDAGVAGNDGGVTGSQSLCGADTWHCVDNAASPGADPSHCKENGAGPFTSAENLARSGCGEDAMMGACPAPGAAGGSCHWTTGGVCYVDVYYNLDETQRQTARNGCPGTWSDM